ncbi:hypothetical protein ACH41H_40615 [Streptomyces sp. NPDC020800]|uniref:hypothetical protein n=1 Tax=Streptomyces sp. NPDC020800 TaxID=3365092 RepID=UPI0037B649D1
MVMPQDIVFHLPFAPEASPDADGARQRSLDLYRRQGLVAHPVDRERFLRWDIAGLMAAWVPRAAGDLLDLTVDAVVVATFLDDQFDGPLAARPSRVAAACRAFTDVIASGGVAPAGTGPLIGAFAQVWRRLAHRASPAWLESTGRQFLAGRDPRAGLSAAGAPAPRRAPGAPCARPDRTGRGGDGASVPLAARRADGCRRPGWRLRGDRGAPVPDMLVAPHQDRHPPADLQPARCWRLASVTAYCACATSTSKRAHGSRA